MNEQNEKNFEYWKELVGLEDTEFPFLRKLSKENINNNARISPTRIKEIQDAIAGNPRVDIQVKPGWGATTLYHYLVGLYRQDNRVLPIVLDFESDLPGDITEEFFVFRVKHTLAKQVVRRLLTSSVQEVYGYAVFSYEDNGSRPWRAHLRRQKERLMDCSDDPAKFYAAYPFFRNRELPDILNYLLKNFAFSTYLMYLFPRKMNGDDVQSLVQIIKNTFDGKDIVPAALREVYVLTPKLFRSLKEFYQPVYKDIQYKSYSAAEIYSMLVSAYQPHDNEYTTINDVIDEAFITNCYKETRTLELILQEVRKKIIAQLDGTPADVPYKLMWDTEK